MVAWFAISAVSPSRKVGYLKAYPNSVFSFVCMRISASNVTLDCNGFSIIGNGSVDNGNALFYYRTISGDAADCPTILAGNAPWSPAQQTAVTGNLCLYNYDVIPARTDLPNSKSSQVYAVGSLSAGVINNVAAAPTGTSKTLIDALDFPRVRNVSCHDSYGRIYQMRTVYNQLFSDIGGRFCPDPVSPTAVEFTSPVRPNALFQNSPNPFSRTTGIVYALARPARIWRSSGQTSTPRLKAASARSSSPAAW